MHSFNRYSYANNNPYKYVDPDGEFIFTAIAIAAVAYAAYDGYQSGGTSGALAEASGYNDAVASYNDIKDGNYGGAVLAAGSIVFKPLKGAKAVAKGVAKPSELFGRQTRGEFTSNQIKKIKKSIGKNGYDQSKPIDIAEVNGRKIIIDGHHRARAAGGAKLNEVPVRIHQVDPATAARYEQQAAEAAHSLGLSNRW